MEYNKGNSYLERMSQMKTIYFAGGCFWGVEHYFSGIHGVVKTVPGYANGYTQNPSYEEVCRKNTGHAETVKVTYRKDIVSLKQLLQWFYEIIDPTSRNRQGPDIGAQYRSGIYYEDPNDRAVIEESLKELQSRYTKPLAVEIQPLRCFYPAEEYHHHYLEKNPGGYCHIDPQAFQRAKEGCKKEFHKKSKQELRESLTNLQYRVTQEADTEPPYQNLYNDHFKPGIYVDITTGEPLFLSTDKFQSGCGWPSFSKPIAPSTLIEKTDESHGMIRTEVRSRIGNAHLGHVFPDGPKQTGGLRYCINSASLRFIPMEQMEEEGYGDYLSSLIKQNRSDC